jgi:hypothetical protein
MEGRCRHRPSVVPRIKGCCSKHPPAASQNRVDEKDVVKSALGNWLPIAPHDTDVVPDRSAVTSSREGTERSAGRSRGSRCRRGAILSRFRCPLREKVYRLLLLRRLRGTLDLPGGPGQRQAHLCVRRNSRAPHGTRRGGMAPYAYSSTLGTTESPLMV